MRLPAPPSATYPIPGPPPVHGAQWDEVRGVWIRWVDDAWLVVEEQGGHVRYDEVIDLTGPVPVVDVRRRPLL